MNRSDRKHIVTETRDWAKVVLAAGVGVSLVILAIQGEMTAAVLLSAAAWLRP